ncbi:MAG: Rab family GTPase, partial [Promethearchaeota archaeon]
MVSYESTLKILLLGDPEVDRSALIRMYVYQSRTPNERLTIGVDFFVKTLVIDDKRYKLQLWDIGGAERFRFLLPTYCFGANAVVFLYDVSRFQTLDNIGEWVDIVRDKSGDIPIMLVGILPDDEYIREVSTEEGVKIAKSRNLNGFIECNLKTGKNIEKVFEDLTRLILADNSKGRKKRELKNAIRSQFLEKVSNKGDMDRLLDGFQIPEEVKKEKQPRLSDEDIKSLDLESEEGV